MGEGVNIGERASRTEAGPVMMVVVSLTMVVMVMVAFKLARGVVYGISSYFLLARYKKFRVCTYY